MFHIKEATNSNGTQWILSNALGCKGIEIYFINNKLIVGFGDGEDYIYLPGV